MPHHDHPVADLAVVACGALRPEIQTFVRQGDLGNARALYTAPGLHEWPGELQDQLTRQLGRACTAARRVVVAYGRKCFIDLDNPSRVTETLVREVCPRAARVRAANCVDMLADASERERIAGGHEVYWLTPAWLMNWDFIFKDWDAAMANETFPRHQRAVVLDGVGFFDAFLAERPEDLLRISDWMKLPIEAAPVSLDRLRDLLLQASAATESSAPAPTPARRPPEDDR